MRISFLDTTGLFTITIRLEIMLILIYGHLFVSLGYNITAEPMAISVCRLVFGRIINLTEAIIAVR